MTTNQGVGGSNPPQSAIFLLQLIRFIPTDRLRLLSMMFARGFGQANKARILVRTLRKCAARLEGVDLSIA